MDDLFNAVIWEKAWKDAPDTRVKKAGIDPARSLDHKAKSFNKQAFSEEGRKRIKRIMNWIEGQGVRFENASVLYISAASGNFQCVCGARGLEKAAKHGVEHFAVNDGWFGKRDDDTAGLGDWHVS